MAYQIDFTASNYTVRSRRKAALRLLALALIAGAVYGVYDVYKTYNEPTLNMKLAEYEVVARPIEEMDAAWDEASKEYNAMLRYYRLLWAASPTNFISAMASQDAPRLGRGFRTVSWTLNTGGKCKLEYSYEFQPGDKAKQAKEIESAMVNSVTSVVKIATNTSVAVEGVKLENLLRVDVLDITANFSLPDVMTFPVKERTLSECVKEIANMRKKVQETSVAEGKNGNPPSTAQSIMMSYLSKGKDKPDFPDRTPAISISDWFDRADRFIVKHGLPGDNKERQRLKESWNRIGNARFPWDRVRVLDNDALVRRTKVLESVSDGVKRFKSFLEQRHADCRRKLEPFVEAYEHNDVFNKPLIDSDLKDRVAKAAGIADATVSFKDETGATPAVLDKDDETFTFTWVRWTLSLGDEERGTGNEERMPLTLAQVADCARRVVELGPGYALDVVKVNFGVDGNVSDAVIEGLLPVKQSKAKKRTRNVD